jgi:hypothetical protein
MPGENRIMGHLQWRATTRTADGYPPCRAHAERNVASANLGLNRTCRTTADVPRRKE